MATTLSAADAATAQFDLLPGRSATLVLAFSSFTGEAVLQKRVGSQWSRVRTLPGSDTVSLVNNGTDVDSYRVWLKARAAGSVDVTFAETGQSQIARIIRITAAGYAALAAPDADTLYVIVG